MGIIQSFGDNSEIEHVRRISMKYYVIFDVSKFWALVAWFHIIQSTLFKLGYLCTLLHYYSLRISNKLLY